MSFGGGNNERPPPVPTVASEQVQAAGLAERQRRQRASGFASTLLTSARGLTNQATTGATQLLGR